ncbi:MAG: PQQ-binding-like beta-propeller repeat protein [Thermoguttaceae bacterium]|jgi:outer membrane protein assembly factor BamB|nr:PQQ-binding-like beta-propeller repeat protein [Thermoguttaceae bacterium]
MHNCNDGHNGFSGRNCRLTAVAGMLAAMSLTAPWAAAAGDWPMWRYDSGHTAASPHDLPDSLHLAWTRHESPRVPVWDDPLNQDMMPYDSIFEPVVAGGRMFLGFNDTDKVVALDIRSGGPLWSFYADGPVRFSPVAFGGKVCFASDDGCLYCLRASDGELLWRFRGAPAAQKVIGNERVISAWPARGGPVERDGAVYFAASIWPFMGTFIYSLDAETGEVRWINDGTSATFIKQPHGAPSFAGVAPQGQLAATAERLLVPGGRSLPAVFDRATGRQEFFNFGAKGQGGSFVAAGESRYFVHTRERGTMAFALSDGADDKWQINEPVLAADRVYVANTPGTSDGQTAPAVIQAFDTDKNLLWQVKADGSGDLIQAGGRLYAAGAGSLVAIELPKGDAGPRIAWSQTIEGPVRRLLAGGGMLFAVTEDGRILAFGAEEDEAKSVRRLTRRHEPSAEAAARAEQLVRQTGARDGYALWFGADDLPLLEGVLAATELHVMVVDADPQRVERLRRHFDEAGLYGSRVAVSAGEPAGFRAPRYMANLMVVGRSLQGQLPELLPVLYESLRPYGGKLWIPADESQAAVLADRVAKLDLAQAKSTRVDGALMIGREGPLPGAAPWTHLYGNVANTVKSDDQRVRLPLGLLWFGGSSNLDVLPRHGHGPSPKVLGGRLFIQGIDSLSARDVYTGRVLWKREFEDLGTFNVFFDNTYAETPLSTAYNQVHLPGANARGSNYVVAEEGVYLVIDSRCLQLDATTGETIREFELPTDGGRKPDWGFVGVYENLLLAGTGFGDYSHRLGYEFTAEGKRGIAWSPDRNASLGLVAFDRHSGRVLWKIDAVHSFVHNAIVAGGGRIYCLDKLPSRVEEQLRRRGQKLPDYRLVALDAASGRILWQRTDATFGSWLGYSVPHDVLLQAGAAASDRSPDEVGKGMATYRGADGTLLWEKRDLSYAGPCILHNDLIITNSRSYRPSDGAFRLLDGSPATIAHPITAEPVAWTVVRTYGCNTAVASEHLLTFRSGAAGFYDLTTHGGTGNFGGFKSGCTSNLIAADGVLNAPEYTRTCTCAYQNQTSLGLVHMPEVDLWTYSTFTLREPWRVQRIGLNLGAPGNRLADNGVLWLDYPRAGGDAPDVPVEVEGDVTYFRHHSSRFSGPGHAWVAASGVEGISSLTIRLATEGRVEGIQEIAVAHPHDDAEENESGAVGLGSSDLELTMDRSQQQIGLRFASIPIAPGAKIRRAYMQFTAKDGTSEATVLSIRGHAADDSPRFSTAAKDVSSRPRTDAEVSWEPPAWSRSDAGPAQQTPDLGSIIEEIVARPGWKQGNALALMITGTGKRVAWSFDGKKEDAARLVIECEPLVDRPQADSATYTVRLHFAEPSETVQPGERVFRVAIQGKTVLERFDILAEAGGARRAVVKEFPGIPADETLTVQLQPLSPASLKPVLCGVEVLQQAAE